MSDAVSRQSQHLSSFIWSVADLLCGDFKHSDYGKVILPFTVLRRLDCVLESTKAKVLAKHEEKTAKGIPSDPFLSRAAKQTFYNTPLSEQTEIITFLDVKTPIKAEAQRGIDLLKEHRSALISAAVTRKIDVRCLVNTEAA